MPITENQIVVYQPNETVRLDVRVENETVWLTQAKLGVLFGVDQTMENRHIHNIYKTGELVKTATCAKIAQVQNAKTEADIAELKDKVNFFVQTKEPPLQSVFYDGQLWDAQALEECCHCENVASCQFQFPTGDLGKKCFGFKKMDASEIAEIKARV